MQAVLQVLENFWGMITEADPNVVIAIFTIVIASTTIVYVWVTRGLLKQSRRAFLIDALARTVQRVEDEQRRYPDKVTEEIEKSLVKGGLKRDIELRWGNITGRVYSESYLKGFCKSLEGIDKKLGRQLREALDDYTKGGLETRKALLVEMIDLRDDMVKELESSKKLRNRLGRQVEVMKKNEK